MLSAFLRKSYHRFRDQYLVKRNLHSESRIHLPKRSGVFLTGEIRDITICENLLDSIPEDIPIIGHVDDRRKLAHVKRAHMQLGDDRDEDFKKELQSIPASGKPMIQWLRLFQSLNLLKEWERSQRCTLEFFLRLRPDLLLVEQTGSKFDIIDDEAVYTHRDHYFFGVRENFLTLCQLWGKRFLYEGKPCTYFNMDYDLLLESDWRCCRHDCIWYPTRIVGEPRSGEELYQAIADNVQLLRSYEYQSNDNLISMSRGLRYFSSEKILPIYLNHQGIRAKSADKYIRFRLDSRRHVRAQSRK